MSLPLLSLVIWLPIFGAVAVLSLGEHRPVMVRRVAFGIAAATFILSLPLFTGFDSTSYAMQFVEDAPWIPTFGIRYSLGVDGISAPLILLTTLSTILVVLAGWESIQYRVSQYMAAFLVMEGVMNGAFAAMDAILFYVFWEGMLIPMFLIIGIWGGPRRIYATIKFFLYTFLGSVFMLVALIYLGYLTGSFNILKIQALDHLGLTAQVLIFIAFMLAFAVKVPMWPVHTWLPDAHVEAPTGGSVILAAIMLKMGGYGFLRLSLPITPDGSQLLSGLMIALSLIAVVYIGFVALVQQDMKKLIAYSSISHMGFVTLGTFAAFTALSMGSHNAAVLGVEGGVVQMVSHGFISGAMFLCVGVLYDRVHSRLISDYGGVANTMPIFATLMVLFAMANSGLPGTSGFVGEFMVILGAFQANVWYAFWAATSLILGAAYTLWMVKRVVFGPIGNDHVAALSDINNREFVILGVLALFVLLLGLWPAPLVDMMRESVSHLVDQIGHSKL
ncbi:NADH-quinone oxidoreductase subunit M [Gammaproteobacteria bacterium]